MSLSGDFFPIADVYSIPYTLATLFLYVSKQGLYDAAK